MVIIVFFINLFIVLLLVKIVFVILVKYLFNNFVIWDDCKIFDIWVKFIILLNKIVINFGFGVKFIINFFVAVCCIIFGGKNCCNIDLVK